MSLQVIGAGFGRTGTLSMKTALEQLGVGPCHHMMEVFDKPEQIPLWQAAADGEAVDWDELFSGYNSMVDWPGCYFWRELADFYPNARVLLTKRDAQKWFESVDATIFQGMRHENVRQNPHGKMVDKLISQNTFNGDINNREHMIDIYNKHNQEVIDSIAPERLLVFEATQGWLPLCNFLQVDVPDTDYPRSNSKEDFAKMVKARARQ